MVSRCGRYVIAYNGEIYNYRELRRELVEGGIELRTESDTEVVLELFARDGEAAFARLVGMFALALYDRQQRSVRLARDSYGIKPLYYADDGWTVRAASQVKALIAGGGVCQDPEPAGVVGFYLWGSVPEPFTLYQDIRAVPPGHVVRVGELGAETARPFLDLPGLYNAPDREPVEADAVREALLASVRRHLVADVPVGLFLSAGIDSTALLAAIHAIDPDRARATTAVTLGFTEYEGTAGDEVPLARRVAARYGADHRVRVVDEAEFRRDLPEILAAMDQPSIDGINTWFVSKAAREAGLKVVLSGVGGDELFAGYPSFRDIPRWRRRMILPSRMPGLGRAWRGIAGTLAARPGANPKLAGLVEHGGTWAGAYLLKRGLFLPHELDDLLDPALMADGLRRLREQGAAPSLLQRGPRDPIGRVSLLESALYMRNQLLRDADWASMAHSLELRTPLVDIELLKAVRPMQHARVGKGVLARAMDLDREIANRAKTGFTTPVGRWTMSKDGHGSKSEPWARSWARRVMGEFAKQNDGTKPDPGRSRIFPAEIPG